MSTRTRKHQRTFRFELPDGEIEILARERKDGFINITVNDPNGFVGSIFYRKNETDAADELRGARARQQARIVENPDETARYAEPPVSVQP